jgi:ATP-binding cassette subfamily C (CFTR/MRP) protein 1
LKRANHIKVHFDNMSAGYNPSTLVLKDLKFSIEPGKKVGICGRTGSGKSSSILSLLRLIEIESGTVRIDNVDLQTLSRHTVRSRLITVPQDPMLIMTDTVRQNLDTASATVSDEDIIGVLKKVKLWSVVQSRTNGAEVAGRQAQDVDAIMGGLDNSAPETEEASPTDLDSASLDVTMKFLPLSQGQQQLFSLARAILMCPTRGKVVLLDEATSNVDEETDRLMQRLIRDEFKEHTILTVAHRLNTIMDSDVVLVFDAGKLVEVGSPLELVEKEAAGGVFKTLYMARSTDS